MLEVSVGATVSLSLTAFRFWFEFRKAVFRCFPFFLPLLVQAIGYELEVWSMNTSDCYHTRYVPGTYIVKKSSYLGGMLRISALMRRISAPRRLSTACLSLWGLLVLGNWAKDCHRYGPSFVLTNATVVVGDTVSSILCRTPCCLRCSTSPWRAIWYFTLISNQKRFENRLTS